MEVNQFISVLLDFLLPLQPALGIAGKETVDHRLQQIQVPVI